MATQSKETLVERLKDAVGLPPGEHLDEMPGKVKDESPRETLTSDDAEGVPPHGDAGTGLRPQD